jgi:hypothetical protein
MSVPSEAAARAADSPRAELPQGASCDICGAPDLRWIHCKLICQQCRTILLSCSDL